MYVLFTKLKIIRMSSRKRWKNKTKAAFQRSKNARWCEEGVAAPERLRTHKRGSNESVGRKVTDTRANGGQSGTQFAWGSIPVRRGQGRGLYTSTQRTSEGIGGRVATFDTRGSGETGTLSSREQMVYGERRKGHVRKVPYKQ